MEPSRASTIAGLQGAQQEAGGGQSQLQFRQARRDPPDDGRVAQPQDAQKRADHERHQGRRQKPREAARPEGEGGERYRADAQGIGVDVPERLRERANRAHEAAGRRRRAEKGQHFDHHDDDADAGHEARNDHIRCVDHEAAGPQRAQKRLQQAAQNDDAQGFAQVRRVGGDDDRHRDRHGRRRA